jgi:hypothetical protein
MDSASQGEAKYMLRVHFKNLLKALLSKKQRNVPAQPENSTATAFVS